MAGRASLKIATNQTLTSSYVVTNTLASFSLTEESLATLEITYTTGAAETAAYLEFQVEYSWDDSTWVLESYSDLVSGVNTLSPLSHKVPGGAGGTSYTAQYFIPLCSRFARVKVKETGVSSNFGTASIVLTVATGMGQQRNLQETSLSTGALTIGTVNQGTGGSSAWKVDGSAVTQPVSGTVAATQSGSWIFSHGKTIKTVTGTVSADTDIVAAVASKRIKVFAYSLISASTTSNTITFQSNASTALWTTPLQAITDTMTGSNLAVSVPSFLFATAAGEKLTLDVSAAQNVVYNVSYFDDDTI